MSFAELLDKCILQLKKTTSRNILAGMGELLSEKQKDWAKANLVSETIFLLRLVREDK
jgi:hypothetical protein